MAEAILDANILLRHLTDEPRGPADRAGLILEKIDTRRIKPVVAPLTLAEVVFVLESVYGWKRREIADRLLTLVTSSVIEFLELETVSQALAWYRDSSNIHFADAYVAALAAKRKALLISFDRGLNRLPGLRVVARPEDI